jgi:hypothetical protein
MAPRIRIGLMFLLVGFGLALLIYLYGCTGMQIQGDCGDEADYAMHVMGKEYPVRVAVGMRHLYGFHGLHARTQALVDGWWQWLCVDYPGVMTCGSDTSFNPERYLPKWAWEIDVMKDRMRVR